MDIRQDTRFQEFNARLKAVVSRAQEDPLGLLKGGFTGSSKDGTVKVWADAIGRPKRVWLAPFSAVEGSEANIAEAVVEACQAAQQAAQDVMLPPRPDAAEHHIARKPRSADDEDFSETSYLRGR